MVTTFIFLKHDCDLFPKTHSEAISNDPHLIFEVSFHSPKFSSAVAHELCVLARLVLVTNVCVRLVCSHCSLLLSSLPIHLFLTHLTPVYPLWVSQDLYESLFDIPNPQLHIPHIIPLKSIIRNNYLI